MAAATQSHHGGEHAPPDDLHWAFSEETNGRWRWRVTARSGRVIVCSAIRFESKAECIADARRYGYAEDAWRPVER